MDFEVWSSESGNRLASFGTVAEATQWILDLWASQGEEAIEGLAVGNSAATWVLKGEDLHKALRDAFWKPDAPLETASAQTVRLPERPVTVAA
jgi:hypothetical protein